MFERLGLPPYGKSTSKISMPLVIGVKGAIMHEI